MKREILLELINRAKDEELGIAIETNNPPRLCQHLDDAMKGTDHGLRACSVNANTAFLVRKTVELNEAPGLEDESSSYKYQPLPR